MLNFTNRLRKRTSILLILVCLAVVGGILLIRGTDEFVVPTAIGDTNEVLTASEDFQYLDRANRAFINLVAKTRPSIVQITTTSNRPSPRIRAEGIPPNTLDSEELRKFLEEFRNRSEDNNGNEFSFRDLIPNTPPPPTPTRMYGSGIIISDDGYILTNNHVIDMADEITVTLANGREYEAELIGKDPGISAVSGTDLAVLKIDAKELPALSFGDSDKLEVGEWVIAIGAPLNLSQTVTRGIVSAKNRGNTRIQYGNFIQTDTPINQGNSGGALINIRGELVGINTLIATNGLTAGNIGIGFAIPSNTANALLPQLIEKGEIVRGWLGISMGPVSHELADKFDLDTARGVLVNEVGQNSPAEKGGIHRGDIILEFNGTTVENTSQLMYSVGSTPVGASVKINLLRNRKEIELTVKLEERTEEALATLRIPYEIFRDRVAPEEVPKSDAFAGMQVQTLSRQLARRYGHQGETGVIVTEVEEGSPASKIGIRVGFLIKEIDYVVINNLKDYINAVKELKEKGEELALVYVKTLNNRGNYVTLNVNANENNNEDR